MENVIGSYRKKVKWVTHFALYKNGKNSFQSRQIEFCKSSVSSHFLMKDFFTLVSESLTFFCTRKMNFIWFSTNFPPFLSDSKWDYLSCYFSLWHLLYQQKWMVIGSTFRKAIIMIIFCYIISPDSNKRLQFYLNLSYFSILNRK